MQDSIHLRSRLASLTWPIFIELLLVMLLGVMDVIMLSRLSDVSVAAVGLVNTLLMTLSLIFVVGSTGTTVVCSQFTGARQENAFTQTVGVSLVLNLFSGAAVSLCLAAWPDAVLRAMNISHELMPEARSYLAIVGGWLALQALSMNCTAILRSRGQARAPMYISLVVNICNIFGNYVLIFGKFGMPALGVQGAAISTVISRAVALGLQLFVMQRFGLLRGVWRQLRPFPLDKLKKILSIGLLGAGEMLSYSCSQVVLIYFIAMLGTEALAARTYVANTVMFVYLFALAIGQAGSITTGYLVGQNHYTAAKLAGAYANRLALCVSLPLSLGLVLLGPWLMPLLSANAAIVQLCLLLLWIDVPLEAGRAANILLGRMLGAVGNPAYPLMVSVPVVWLVATLGGCVAGVTLGWGLAGMWAAFACDECIRGVILWRYWQSFRWKNRGFCPKKP